MICLHTDLLGGLGNGSLRISIININAAELCQFWREEISRARQDVMVFPRDKAGTCVLDKAGNPFRGALEELSVAIDSGDVIFHEGRICGAWPKII